MQLDSVTALRSEKERQEGKGRKAE